MLKKIQVQIFSSFHALYETNKIVQGTDKQQMDKWTDRRMDEQSNTNYEWRVKHYTPSFTILKKIQALIFSSFHALYETNKIVQGTGKQQMDKWTDRRMDKQSNTNYEWRVKHYTPSFTILKKIQALIFSSFHALYETNKIVQGTDKQQMDKWTDRRIDEQSITNYEWRVKH